MVAFRGHFDGKVVVPSEAADLPRGPELLLHVALVGEPVQRGSRKFAFALFRFDRTRRSFTDRAGDHALS